MGLYRRYILPKIVDVACSSRPCMKQREKIVPLARGIVLEIGAGSGLNFASYDVSRVERVFALEPAEEMRTMAEARAVGFRFPIEMVPAPAESIPLDQESVDTIVVTYSLCTVPDLDRALTECKRVLRVGGELLFCEHGRSNDESVYAWQRRINPIWKRLSGGCHLDRDIPGFVETAGLRIDWLDTMYLPGGPRFATYNFWGRAAKA